jgi:hypothetical protein
MASILLRTIKSTANTVLAPAGLRLARLDDHGWDDTANFIPFERTVADASAAQLSVGDYVDGVMNGVPGSSQATIDLMASAGVFSQGLDTIVEIGPGTGRYLEKTVKAAQPKRYEIYETAGPWRSYLISHYELVAQKTDGYSLAETPDASADLVHAHKVFSGVPFMVTCCYWHEMARVIRPGGWAVFDILTERCLEGDALTAWAKSGIRNGAYPAVVPRALAVQFLASRGFELKASHMVPMSPGTTELMLFRRNIGATH